MQFDDGTVVKEPGWVWALVWTGFPLVGVGLGALAVWVADGAADQRWLPFRGLFRLLDRYAGTPATIIAMAVGAALGLGLAVAGVLDRLTVTVGNDSARLRRGDTDNTLDRSQTAAVYADGKELVAVGPDGAELAREKHDLPAAELREAFRGHGWPWRDTDPYGADFRLWVEGLPDLPPGADPLLRARAKVLSKKDDAAELRRELARIGIVVKDARRKQYVRTLG